MKRRTVLEGLVAASGLALVGCGPGDGAAGAARDRGGLRLIRFACDPWSGYYPAALAEDLGYFAEEGLTVSMVVPGNTDRMLAEFAAAKFDLIAASVGDFITLVNRRPDMAIVLSSDESSGGDKVMQRRGFVPSPGEVIRIGTDLGGFGELFMRDYLAHAGLTEARVQWLDVDAAEVGAALEAGVIDLGNTWEPFAAEAIAAGHPAVFSSVQTPGLVTQVVVTSSALAREREADLRGFCRGWFRAVDRWLAEADAAARRIEARLGLSAGEASLEGIRLHTLADNRRLPGGGEQAALRPILRRYADFFAERGEAPGDLDGLFHPHLLP